MPTYDYSCLECDNDQEVSHGINERPRVECSKCGGSTIKAFTAIPAIFKGSGWGKG